MPPTSHYAVSDSGTALQMFQREMGQHRLLTVDQEIELFIRIEAGDIKARDIMVASNLRLVYSIALKYLWAVQKYTSLDLIDLVQEGCIGMMKAIDKFAWSEGYKFSTYATWWIRQAIQQAIYNKADAIRLPVHINEKRYRVQKALKKLLAREGDWQPTHLQIAHEAKVSLAEVKRIMEYELMTPTSSDQLVGDDENTSLIDLVEDEQADNPLQELLRELVKTRIIEIINELDVEPRIRMMLSLRFGFEDNRAWVLQEIADVFEITRERVRQLLEKGLAKVREHHAAELEEYATFDFGPNDDFSFLRAEVA